MFAWLLLTQTLLRAWMETVSANEWMMNTVVYDDQPFQTSSRKGNTDALSLFFFQTPWYPDDESTPTPVINGLRLQNHFRETHLPRGIFREYEKSPAILLQEHRRHSTYFFWGEQDNVLTVFKSSFIQPTNRRRWDETILSRNKVSPSHLLKRKAEAYQ